MLVSLVRGSCRCCCFLFGPLLLFVLLVLPFPSFPTESACTNPCLPRGVFCRFARKLARPAHVFLASLLFPSFGIPLSLVSPAPPFPYPLSPVPPSQTMQGFLNLVIFLRTPSVMEEWRNEVRKWDFTPCRRVSSAVDSAALLTTSVSSSDSK